MDFKGTFYLKCSTIPIWNFHHIGKDFDYRYLAKADDVSDVDYLPINAPKIWNDIFNEYCEISDNKESQAHLQNVAQLNELIEKYSYCSLLLEMLCIGLDKETEQEYFKELSSWGFSFNQGNLLKELKRAKVWLKSIKTNINMIEAEILSNQKKKTHHVRLEKQQVKLERLTGKNDINLRTTSGTKWLMIIKDAEEQARQKEKQRNKAA